MSEKNKGGRPSKYDDEESARIGARIRPRYKELLELIAQHRQTTVSEALELAVAQLGMSYLVDNKPMIDFVRPQDESYMIIYNSLNFDDLLDYFESGGNVIIPAFDSADEEVKKFLDKPSFLLSPFELYLREILLSGVMTGIGVSIFNISDLFSAIRENWKVGLDSKLTVNYIMAIKEFYTINPEDMMVGANNTLYDESKEYQDYNSYVDKKETEILGVLKGKLVPTFEKLNDGRYVLLAIRNWAAEFGGSHKTKPKD